MNQVTVSASYDSGIWLSFDAKEDPVSGYQETVSIQFAGSGLAALIALLRILKEMILDLNIVYKIGGYTVGKELWATYVLGDDCNVSQIP